MSDQQHNNSNTKGSEGKDSPALAADSVGIVSPRSHHFDQPIELACGRTLKQYDLVYETYGELNENQSNAILICHALSGHQHAAASTPRNSGRVSLVCCICSGSLRRILQFQQ